MTNKIKDRPRAPLSSAATAFVTLQRAADLLGQDLAALLRPYGLSLTQYNVLRILRGARPAGLPCGEVGARMINKDPDVTRLLDRMEKQGWIARQRSTTDRRVVTVHISPAGLALVNQLDVPVNGRHDQTLGRLGKPRLTALAQELAAVCESCGPGAASK